MFEAHSKFIVQPQMLIIHSCHELGIYKWIWRYYKLPTSVFLQSEIHHMFIFTPTHIHNTLTVSQYLESSLLNCVFWFFGQIITSRRAAGCKIILHVVPTTAKWFSGRLMHIYPLDKFLVPDWREKVAGKGLSYRPARLHIGWQAG